MWPVHVGIVKVVIWQCGDARTVLCPLRCVSIVHGRTMAQIRCIVLNAGPAVIFGWPTCGKLGRKFLSGITMESLCVTL